MPALTVKAITKSLSGYVRPDEDITAKLNLIMPRLYAMGMWRDLLFDWTIETTNPYFSLPEHADAVLGSMLSNSPTDIQSQWHDYRISGYAEGGPAPIYGIVDDGFSPIKEDLLIEENTDLYQLSFRAVSPATMLPSEGTITVSYGNGTDSEIGADEQSEEDFAMGGEAFITSTDVNVVEVNQIRFEDLPTEVDVYAVHQTTAADTHLARVRGDGVSRYRRFRFENSSGRVQNAKLLLKRAWQPVINPTDVVYLGNLNAIKHGLLATLAEDNADVERAEYHWAVCSRVLEEELDSVRGAAKPKVRLAPVGRYTPTPNLI